MAHDELVDFALVLAAQIAGGVLGRMDRRMRLIRFLALPRGHALAEQVASEAAPSAVGRLHLYQRPQVQLLRKDVGLRARVRDVT